MEELLEKYMKQYENDLKELSNKNLKWDYINWFQEEYSIEELEKVKRDEMIWNMVEAFKLIDRFLWYFIIVTLISIVIVTLKSCVIREIQEKHHVITEDGVNWYSTEEYEDGYDIIEEPEYIE